MQNSVRKLTRREAVQRILAAATALAFVDSKAFGAPFGGDPDLHSKPITWERILSEREMKTVTVLCDTIIPADEKSPAASSVGVPDFINEWVSAPYPTQVEDLRQIRAGLAWLDEESGRRFQRPFAELEEAQIKVICDEICSGDQGRPALKAPAAFFSKFRNLTAGGFYSTPEGWADLEYVGNKPMAEFPGPPPEVLKHLGLA